MKKIGKLRLDELKKNVKVLTPEEQRRYVGGQDVWRIAGGYLYEVEGGTLFCGDDDRSVWFPGVSVTTWWTKKDTAYQYNGTIHIDENWLENGFNIYDFAHEYGHYIQQYLLGDEAYDRYIAIPSMHDLATDPEHHDEQWYEKDATERGYHHLYDQEYY